MRCTACGKNIDDNTKFCKYCGAPAGNPKMIPPEDEKKCEKCGAAIKEGNAFCTKCGNPIGITIIDEDDESDDDQKKSRFPLIIVFLILITLLLLGFLIYWFPVRNYLGKKKEADQSYSASEQSEENGSDTDSGNQPADGQEENKKSETDSGQTEAKETTYTIICKGLDDITLFSEEKNGVSGEQVTEYAPDLEGYTAQETTQTLVLQEDSSDNVIIFIYALNEEDSNDGQNENIMVEYSIVCIDDVSGTTLHNKTYYGEPGTDITVQAPEIQGYVPKQDEMSITLSDDASNNVMHFVYSEENRVIDDASDGIDIPAGNILVYDGHTYYAFRTGSIGSYQEAQEYCINRGGYLATIDDDEENTALYEYVLYDRGFDSAYFGLTDEGSEGSWYWVDGTPVNYTNWLSGQPDNHGGSEDYALFYYKDKAYKWNDGDFGPDNAGTVTFIIEWDYVQ